MPESISDILRKLKPGEHVMLDSGVGRPMGHRGGIRSGAITVTRSKRPISVRAGGTSLGEFSVSGVTTMSVCLTADDAQADVGRRQRIRDDQ